MVSALPCPPEAATTSPQLSGLVPPLEHLFLQTFWQTMNREWPGIDRLRLDKFYMVRMLPAPRKGPRGAGLGTALPEPSSASRLLTVLRARPLRGDLVCCRPGVSGGA